MELLKDYVLVKTMLRLLEETGKQEQAKEATCLIAAMDSMGQRHDAFMSEVSDGTQQIVLATGQHYPLRSFAHELTAATRQWAGELHFWFARNREQIITEARTAVAKLDGQYVPVWNPVSSVRLTQNLLETMREKIIEGMNGITESIRQVEVMEKDPPGINGQLEDFMGYFSDMDDVYRERFKDALDALRSAHSSLNLIDQSIGEALDAAHRLEPLAERAERFSIWERLRADVSAHPSPEPAKRFREFSR